MLTWPAAQPGAQPATLFERQGSKAARRDAGLSALAPACTLSCGVRYPAVPVSLLPCKKAPTLLQQFLKFAPQEDESSFV